MNIHDKIHNGTATLDDQEEVLKHPRLAYLFALLNISGTDIEKCQKIACQDPVYALCFAEKIPEANIEYCRRACENNKYWLKEFDEMIAKRVLA